MISETMCARKGFLLCLTDAAGGDFYERGSEFCAFANGIDTTRYQRDSDDTELNDTRGRGGSLDTIRYRYRSRTFGFRIPH